MNRGRFSKFRQNAYSSVGGPGDLQIYKFLAPAPPFVVPEPAGLGALALLVIPMLVRRSRIQKSDQRPRPPLTSNL